jgi:methyl-accepting chemotaxis protein
MENKSPSRFLGVKIIKTGFQFKFSLIVFLFLAFSAGSIWFWGHATVNQMIESGMVHGEDAIASMQMLQSNIAYISLLALAITFGLSLFFSHYIAGPIYRFEKTLESMRDQGDLTIYVRLRKRDEFKETADLFNQALVGLRNRVKKEREGVSAQVQKLAELSPKLNSPELNKIVEDLKNNPPQLKI